MEIRPGQRDDLPQITEIYNYYVRETPITFDLDPYTVEEREPWFKKFSPTGRHRLFVAEENGAIQAYAGSGRFRQKDAYLTSVETTIYVKPDFAGNGLGSELYAVLFSSLEGEDIHRAYGGVTLPNDASVALHRKFGFEECGVMREVGRKFDQYWDVAWLQKEL